MRIAISVASMLACALSVDAQLTTRLTRLPGGMDEVRLRNNSAINVVAFAVSAGRTNGEAPYAVSSDTLIDLAATPLLPNEERVVIMHGFAPMPPWRALRRDPNPSSTRTLAEPIVTAGILSDGTTVGDAGLLARLVLRRSNMLLAVETTLETLSDAGRRNIPKEQLIQQFKYLGRVPSAVVPSCGTASGNQPVFIGGREAYGIA